VHQRVVGIAAPVGQIPGESAMQALIVMQRLGVELVQTQQQRCEDDRQQRNESAVRLDPGQHTSSVWYGDATAQRRLSHAKTSR
jgi:hypothetical protein